MPSRTVAIAMAFSLALVSGAFAGQNENATFALVGDAEVTGVGAGDRVSLEVSAEGFVGVKQLQVVLEVSGCGPLQPGFRQAGAGGRVR